MVENANKITKNANNNIKMNLVFNTISFTLPSQQIYVNLKKITNISQDPLWKVYSG